MGGAQLLAVALALGVHPAQLAGPAGAFELADAGALADLAQQVGGELGEQG